MSEALLELRNITKRFAGVNALNDVSLSIAPGEVVCLVGENGSGKSTLIKVIAGVHPPDIGVIVLDGQEFSRLRPIESIHHGIQVIFQDFSLFPNLSVAENIAVNEAVSAGRSFVNWGALHATAKAALDRIQVSLDLSAPAGSLPVVDRQLIAIAKALLQNARLIIMDEPTTALSQREIQSLFAVIHRLKQDGISTLFVSHKLDEVLEIADRTAIIRNGNLVMDRPAAGLTRGEMIRAMTGRDISDETLMTPVPADAPPALTVRGLGLKGVFADISLTVRAGEVVGVTGLLGSGRTNLALSLFGMTPADKGEITVGGKRVLIRSVQDALNAGIGYVPEDRLKEGLFLPQSIGNNIVVRSIDQLARGLGVIDGRAVNGRITEWMERLRIRARSTEDPVTSLSGGNQQRVVLAKWLASAPRVLILNGPTVGVDIGSKREIHEIVGRLAGQGMAILVISDDVPELLQICHRIFVMKRGRFVNEFERSRITETELNAMLVAA